MPIKKTILITGCSSGFGFHTSILLANSGHQVISTVRRQKDLRIFSDLPTKIRPKTILLDVTWPQPKINQTTNNLYKKYPINVLINNAGLGFLGATSSFTVKEFQKQLDVNLLGPFKLAKAILPHFRKKKSGLIININSIAGIITIPGYGIYSSSKFALNALTQAFASEEKNSRIQFVSVYPGSFATNFWQNEKFPTSRTTSYFKRFNQNLKNSLSRPRFYRSHPNKFAQKIKSIIESNNPKERYFVGLDANILYLLHRLLPHKFFNLLLDLLKPRE
jgi:short-subunit dehydrogenase